MESSDDFDSKWISWFCSLDGHEFLVEVPEYFIREEHYNIYSDIQEEHFGLQPAASFFK